MASSEPDTVFFRDCVNFVLDKDEFVSDDGNVRTLAAMEENAVLLDEYYKWFEFYKTVFQRFKYNPQDDAPENLKKSESSTKIEYRLRQLLINLQPKRRSKEKRA